MRQGQGWMRARMAGLQGVRVAMTVHHTHEYETMLLPGASPCPGPELSVTYAGVGPGLSHALALAVHGGQVVLTDAAWEHVKAAMVAHPGACGAGGNQGADRLVDHVRRTALSSQGH